MNLTSILIRYRYDDEKPLIVRKQGHDPLMEAPDQHILAMGTPIINKVISLSSFAWGLQEFHSSSSASRAKLAELNGAFLGIKFNFSTGKVVVINDRFASFPFFYASTKEGDFYGSTSYLELVQCLEEEVLLHPLPSVQREIKNEILRLNKKAIVSFLHFQRLYGNQCYHLGIKYLDSASVLLRPHRRQNFVSDKYWNPSFKKSNLPEKDFAKKLQEDMVSSFRSYTSDGEKSSFALLLSGGLDSRFVLGLAKQTQRNLTCFTLGSHPNNEFQVAASLAKTYKYPHHFVQRDDRAYFKRRHDLAHMGHGMSTFTHGHFLSLEKIDQQLRKLIPAVFHGHGVDYFFQGMYLPQERVKILGRPTLVMRLKEIPDVRHDASAFVSYYLRQIKFRLKSVFIFDLLKEEWRDEMLAAIEKDLLALTEQALSLGAENSLDVWEYLNSHNLSRHYTNLNLQSMRSTFAQRTFTFENQLFDDYWAMPVAYRLNSRVLKRVLKNLDPTLAHIRNANFNARAGSSAHWQSLVLEWGQLISRFGIKGRGFPSAQERSWPDFARLLRENWQEGEKYSQSFQWDKVVASDLWQIEKVQEHFERHWTHRGEHADLINSLFSLQNVFY